MSSASARTLALFALLFIFFAGSLPGRARAGVNRTVNTLADVSSPAPGFLTLRQAIAASAEGDSIDFAVTGTITLTHGELAVSRGLTIRGPGARSLTIDANHASRVFDVSGGGGLTLSGLTLTSGKAPVGPTQGDVYGSSYGGAILSNAPITLTECAVQDSTAAGAGGGGHQGGPAFGGGIAAFAGATLVRCLVSGNQALRGNGVLPATQVADGGGLYVSFGPLTLVDTTIANNTATTGAGGVALASTGPNAATACTISGNSCAKGGEPASAGGVSASAAPLALRNTIVSGNVLGAGANDVAGAAVSQGHNWIGADGGAIAPGGGSPWQASDRVGTTAAPQNAFLGPLHDNGGPTDTLAPISSSGVLNAGDDALPSAPLAVTVDQRGLPRRLGSHVDIGAYETDVPQAGPHFIVNSLEDHDEGIPGQGQCTLREAIVASNADGDSNLITFQPGLAGVIEVATARGAYPVVNPVNIAGPGARSLTVNGHGTQLFNVTADGVTLSDLTLRHGVMTGFSAPEFAGDGQGGAVYNEGTLTVNACTLADNIARGGAGATGASGKGGGVFNFGTLTLNGCTFAGNAAQSGTDGGGQPFGGDGEGGAVWSGGTLTMTNCTLAGNTTSAYPGDPSKGGGLFNVGNASLLNCTISQNSADKGGGIDTEAGRVRPRNTLVAGNAAPSGPDVSGAFLTSDGNNLVGRTDGSTGWTAKDKTGTAAAPLDPKLSPLANNGGPTDTMALNAGSPALNAANAAFAPVTDQRVFIRNGPPEIGAYEYLGFAAVAPSDTSVSPNSGASAPNTARSFTCKYRDGNGAFDIHSAFFLVNTRPTAAGGLYCYYDNLRNKLFLRNSAGTAWAGGVAPGTAGSINDPGGYGALNTAATTVTHSGNFLTIQWVLVPNVGLAGAKNLYMSCLDKEGFAGGWDLMGTWQVNSPPQDLFVSPGSGSSKAGTARLITGDFVDGDGSADFAGVFLVVGTDPSGAGGIWCFYDAVGNRLYLRNAANSGWLGGFAPGSAHVISEPGGRGSLDCAATHVAKSATGLSVAWSLTPAAGFTGAKNLYLTCKDKEGLGDGPDQLGTWTIMP